MQKMRRKEEEEEPRPLAKKRTSILDAIPRKAEPAKEQAPAFAPPKWKYSKPGQLLPDFKPMDQTLEEFFDAMPALLRTKEGQVHFCDGLQQKLNSLYDELDAEPLVISKRLREEIGNRISKIDQMRIFKANKPEVATSMPPFGGFSRTMFDRYGLLSAIPITGGFFFYLFSPKASFSHPRISLPVRESVDRSMVEHELLHVASGSIDISEFNPLKSLADTVLAPFRLVSDAITSLFGRGMVAHTRIPIFTLEETMTSSVIGSPKREQLGDFEPQDSTVASPYWQWVSGLKFALSKLPNTERKEMLDCLVLAWLNSGTQEQKEKAEEFIHSVLK